MRAKPRRRAREMAVLTRGRGCASKWASLPDAESAGWGGVGWWWRREWWWWWWKWW